MSRPEPQTLAFIHGVGGNPGQDRWLEPLSNVMASIGSSRPEKSGIEIVTVDYRDALLAPTEAAMPKETWRRARDGSDDYSQYQVRRAELDRIVRQYKQAPPLAALTKVPQPSTETLATLVEGSITSLRQEARRYRTDEKARAAVLTRVLAQLPSRGRVVIIGHSLGSVVAADLVKRLPAEVTVDQLLTIGSPLPMSRFWPFVSLTGAEFPFDRVRSWVNVFDSLDFVTGGRGLGRWYPEAVDADVHLGRLAAALANHACEYYLSLPLVGALVADALCGPSNEAPAGKSSPARRLGPDWDLYLLGAA